MTSSAIKNSLILISILSIRPCDSVISKAMLQSSGIAIATVHSILVVIDIVGNCLVCAIIKKNQDMRYGVTRITMPF